MSVWVDGWLWCQAVDAVHPPNEWLVARDLSHLRPLPMLGRGDCRHRPTLRLMLGPTTFERRLALQRSLTLSSPVDPSSLHLASPS